jgi:hypothetical protein
MEKELKKGETIKFRFPEINAESAEGKVVMVTQNGKFVWIEYTPKKGKPYQHFILTSQIIFN